MRRLRDERGQAAVELAIQLPLMLVLLFGVVQVARVIWVYHTLQKALHAGAGFLAQSLDVNYCDASDLTVENARNFMVYGNLQGQGTPVVTGLTPDMIQVVPERQEAGTTAVNTCVCTQDPEGCDLPGGGRTPEFVVVNLGTGFPLQVPFPYVSLGAINLRVSVRMPVTGS